MRRSVIVVWLSLLACCTADPTVSGEFIGQSPRAVIENLATQVGVTVRFQGENHYFYPSLRLEAIPFEQALDILESVYSIKVRKLANDQFLVVLGPEAPKPAPVDLKAEFLNALRRHEVARIRGLLDEKPEMVLADLGGSTALNRAVQSGSVKLTRLLLSRGATDQPNVDEKSPIAVAAEQGYVRCLSLLLQHGQTERESEKWLLFFCEREAFDKLLTSRRAKIARDHSGNTLLHSQAYIRALRDSPDQEKWRYAQEFLRLGVPLDVLNNDGQTALHQSIWSGNLRLAQLLLRSGADPNAPTPYGMTPVMFAAEKDTNMLGLLLGQRVDLLQRDDRGRSVLHYAVSGGIQNIRDLLKRGVPVNALTNNGISPLLRAVLWGKKDIADYLRAHGGVELPEGCEHLRDRDGSTTLHQVVGSDLPALTRELLRRGSDPNAARADLRTPLLSAALDGQAANVQLLLEYGADREWEDQNGVRALAYAAMRNRVEAGKTLIRAGANVNAKSKEGNTALHFAATAGNVEFVELLLDSGADPKLTNNVGKTALQLVHSGSEKKAALEALLKNREEVH